MPELSESRIEAGLVSVVRQAGGLAIKWSAPARRGVPDRLVILPGPRVIGVEVKAARGRLSRLQERTLVQLRALGLETAVVRSMADVARLVAGAPA